MRLRILLWIALACGVAPAGAAEIVRRDPRFDRLVPHDAVVEKLLDGFMWVEGPVWNRAGGFLLFSDIPRNSVFKWKEGEGASVFLRPSGYTGAESFTGERFSGGNEDAQCVIEVREECHSVGR